MSEAIIVFESCVSGDIESCFDRDSEAGIIDSDPILPPNETDLKNLLRKWRLGIFSPKRRIVWKLLACRYDPDWAASISTYRDTMHNVFGSEDSSKISSALAQIFNSNNYETNYYFLTEEGQMSVRRIVECFAYNCPDVTRCPTIIPLAIVFKHFLQEDVTYTLLTYFARSVKKRRYFAQTKTECEIDWRTVMEMCLTIEKVGFQTLGVKDEGLIESFFQKWQHWIFGHLPFQHVVRIVDCYIVEGIKVLYRVFFSLIRTFAKQIKNENEKWSYEIKTNGLEDTFIKFCLEIPVSANELLDRAFRFRRFSSESILRVSTVIIGDIKRNGTRCRTSQSRKQSTFMAHAISSEILNRNMLKKLWACLPSRICIMEPSLAFSSNVHGSSLSTFYAMSEIFEATLLFIRITTGEVFGAYLSTSWQKRHGNISYFGTGECFLFKFTVTELDSPALSVFPWASDTSGARPSTSRRLTSLGNCSNEYFMSGNSNMIAIGGGGDGIGLYVSSDLTIGRTQRCETFNNEPLCEVPGGDFQISVLEVVGFNKFQGV